MGEIRGFGISHHPGVVVDPQYWSRFLITRTEAGQVPRELFENKAAWPAAMRDEWADDQGAAAAAVHRGQMLAASAKVRAELDAFDPDFAVIWGDDQFENFTNDCIPPFCIYIFDHAVTRPYNPRFFGDVPNVWGVDRDAELEVRGRADAAGGLCRALLDDGFDVAYAYQTRHRLGLAHSFNNALMYLDFDRKGFPWPIVPFHVNCYGNRMVDLGGAGLSPPSPSPRRCFDIGGATARFFADSEWRVALIASSSWSHANLTEKTGWLYPDIASDRARLAELKDGNFVAWRDLPRAEVEDAGQHEFLNWICLAGAMAEAGHEFEVIDFLESHVFNSNKCFGVSCPRG